MPRPDLLDPVLLKQRVLGPNPLFRGRFRRSRRCIGYAGLNNWTIPIKKRHRTNPSDSMTLIQPRCRGLQARAMSRWPVMGVPFAGSCRLPTMSRQVPPAAQMIARLLKRGTSACNGLAMIRHVTQVVGYIGELSPAFNVSRKVKGTLRRPQRALPPPSSRARSDGRGRRLPGLAPQYRAVRMS